MPAVGAAIAAAVVQVAELDAELVLMAVIVEASVLKVLVVLAVVEVELVMLEVKLATVEVGLVVEVEALMLVDVEHRGRTFSGQLSFMDRPDGISKQLESGHSGRSSTNVTQLSSAKKLTEH